MNLEPPEIKTIEVTLTALDLARVARIPELRDKAPGEILADLLKTELDFLEAEYSLNAAGEVEEIDQQPIRELHAQGKRRLCDVAI